MNSGDEHKKVIIRYSVRRDWLGDKKPILLLHSDLGAGGIVSRYHFNASMSNTRRIRSDYYDLK